MESEESHPHQCESCMIGKQHRNLVRIPRTRASAIGEIVHTDISGGGRMPATRGGARYVIKLIDDFSNFMYVYLLQRKDQTPEVMKDYFALMKNRGTPVKMLRSDNGGEFAGHLSKNLLKQFHLVFIFALLSPKCKLCSIRGERKLRKIIRPLTKPFWSHFLTTWRFQFETLFFT